MRHTYQQAKNAAKKLITYFSYKKSDFYDDGKSIFCTNYEDCERPAYDVLIELNEIRRYEESERREERRNTIYLRVD